MSVRTIIPRDEQVQIGIMMALFGLLSVFAALTALPAL
jgi:hypothetical protein